MHSPSRNLTITFFNQQAESTNSLLVKLVTDKYRQGQRVFVLCQDKKQMMELDEVLWQLDPDSFLAHATIDEPASNKAPIVLANSEPDDQPFKDNQLSKIGRFACWFNLTEQALSPIPATSEVIEFVPIDEAAKQLARDRFKTYCQLGIKPSFNDLSAV